MACSDVGGRVSDGADSPAAARSPDRAKALALKQLPGWWRVRLQTRVAPWPLRMAKRREWASDERRQKAEEHGGGEAQQTQLAILLVLHRTPGIGSPRGFIRFSRCLFRRILNRSGFAGVFALGRGGAMAEVHSFFQYRSRAKSIHKKPRAIFTKLVVRCGDRRVLRILLNFTFKFTSRARSHEYV